MFMCIRRGMIHSFADQESRELFEGIRGHALHKKFTGPVLKIMERRLDLLNCAENLEELRHVPALQGEASVRDAHGKYSIPLLGNWRIAFKWNKDGPEDVEIKS